MARHPGRGDAREVLDERPHLHRAERTVDADDERPCVLHREPERIDCLAGQVAAATVDRGEGDPERQVRRLVERGGDRRLRVQRVEDRLDQEEVDATFGEPADLLRVGVPDLLECVRPISGLVDTRRERQRHVQRPDGARDEAADLVGRLPGQPRARDVHLARVRLEGIVGLADRGRREGVRGGDVGARGKVVAMDAEDDLGSRQVEQIGIACDVARVIFEALAPICLLASELTLDEHAPRAVEHGNPLPEDGCESCARVLHPVPFLRPKENVACRGRTGSLGVF